MLAILPVAGEHAKNPSHISCVENELGLREFLEARNCEYIVTAGVATILTWLRFATMSHESFYLIKMLMCLHTQ